MTVKNQELYNIIETLPEELSNKVIDYIEYLKFTMTISNGPDNLIIKNSIDLRDKLKEGIEDSENGSVCSIDEVFSEIEEMFVE